MNYVVVFMGRGARYSQDLTGLLILRSQAKSSSDRDTQLAELYTSVMLGYQNSRMVRLTSALMTSFFQT